MKHIFIIEKSERKSWDNLKYPRIHPVPKLNRYPENEDLVDEGSLVAILYNAEYCEHNIANLTSINI